MAQSVDSTQPKGDDSFDRRLQERRSSARTRFPVRRFERQQLRLSRRHARRLPKPRESPVPRSALHHVRKEVGWSVGFLFLYVVVGRFSSRGWGSGGMRRVSTLRVFLY